MLRAAGRSDENRRCRQRIAESFSTGKQTEERQ
jgi:hypothetical protein